MSGPALHVVTYNIHKGFSPFNRQMMVHELRESLRELSPDLVFLQEVQGRHSRHAQTHENWPAEPQYAFLADGFWPAAAYGRNAIYDHGHHGNAILSRYPIAHAFNQDVTHLRFERRGLLHCVLEVPELAQPLHCACVHLSLFARSRRRQMDALAAYLEAIAPDATPLIVAGDFNDWRNEAEVLLAERLGLREALGDLSAGGPVRSFPARKPMLRLDRIYVRGFTVEHAAIHLGPPWANLSDHAPLSARLVPLTPRA